jgi:hypothetical protein
LASALKIKPPIRANTKTGTQGRATHSIEEDTYHQQRTVTTVIHPWKFMIGCGEKVLLPKTWHALLEERYKCNRR